jgi:hypothetical protein
MPVGRNFTLDDCPEIHPAGQGGVTREKKNPALRCGQDFSISGTDGVRAGAGVKILARIDHFLVSKLLVDQGNGSA